MKTRTRMAAAIALTAALGMGGAIGNAPPASAFSQASFPVVVRYHKGIDVQAIQYLLVANGHSVSVDGAFGEGTEGAVKAFQSKKGLTPDGKVGANTWAALAPTIRNGSSGNAVKALQILLNRKRGAGLVVDGKFGTGTYNAVRAFQSHAGITPDGVVGDTTWRNLSWHYVVPSTSHICNKDPDQNADANWGTGSTVGLFEAASARFAATGQGKVPYGDISEEHGGDIAGHASHEKGVDVDIWPIRTDSAQCSAGRITWQSSTYDRAATRQLVQYIRSTAVNKVVLIFFNDPTLIREGIVQQYPNHDNHLHVRYQ